MNVKLEREREETFGEIFPRSPYHTRLIFTWSYAETCCAFWEIFLIFIYFYDDEKILQFTAHFLFIMKRNFTPTSSPRYNPRNAVDKHYFNLHLKNISSVSFYECMIYEENNAFTFFQFHIVGMYEKPTRNFLIKAELTWNNFISSMSSLLIFFNFC